MNQIKTSKFLSFVLRHRPDSIGIELDDNGWIEIDTLIEAASKSGKNISRSLLLKTVADNDKQRFAISDDGNMIRASQGHSVEVDLDLEAVEPPELLFHGTVERFLDSIRKTGLVPGSRHDVHLSSDMETAERVGSRRGKPIVLVIEAQEMYCKGQVFKKSVNGVWLTAQVPAAFIRFPDSGN